MFKKISATILFLGLLTSQAYASNFDGAYIGGAVGYGSDHYNMTDTGLGSLAGISLTDDMGSQGAMGEVFAGYGKKFGNLYAGLEANANLSDREANLTLVDGASSVTSNLTHKYDYGFAFRGGVFPADNTLLYGKIGATWGMFEDKAVNTSQTLTGLQVGLGVETALNSVLTVRADWTYVDYKTATYTDAFQTGSASPTSNVFMVGLAYNF